MKKSLIIILIIVILGGLGYFAYSKGFFKFDFLKRNNTEQVEKVKTESETIKESTPMLLKISDATFTIPSDWKVERKSKDEVIMTMSNSNFPFKLSVGICDSNIWRDCFGREAVWQENFIYPTSTATYARFGFTLQGGNGYYEAGADFGTHEISDTEYKALDAVIHTARFEVKDILAELIPIKSVYSIYEEGASDPRGSTEDMVTPDGWKIEYLVKDKTKTEDLYIKYSKVNKVGVYYAPNVLTFRSYFIPQYAGENNNYIFLTHACATGSCRSVEVLSKNDTNWQTILEGVLNFDVDSEQIVYTSDYDTKEPFKVNVVNLGKKKDKELVFKNICPYLAREGCAGEISFGKDYVKMVSNLEDKNGKEVTEEQIMRFDN